MRYDIIGHGGRHIAPGILDQGYQIIGNRSANRILKIKQAAGGDAFTAIDTH